MQVSRCHHEVENHIYREALPYLCKIFYSDFLPISNLEIEKIEDIISKTVIHRVKKGQSIDIVAGGFLVKGEFFVQFLRVSLILIILFFSKRKTCSEYSTTRNFHSS